VTVDGWRHRVANTPERARRRAWVAVAGGEVVGQASAGRRWFTKASRSVYVDVAVRADRRRHGIGATLYDLAEAHALSLEPRRLVTSFHESPAGVRFSEARGFQRGHVAVPACVDPRAVDYSRLDDLPHGVALASYAELADRLEDVYAVDVEASLDEPGIEPADDVALEEWLHDRDNPLFAPEGSFCALDAGRPVALTELYVDAASGRARNGFTGTLRSHRGRGLASLVKLAALRWAAAAGLTSIWTANDETNAPMLAVNRRLGYRPSGRDVEAVRELTESGNERPDTAVST
jgi:GNAT superfamily N-acetyltransferase